MKSKAVQVGAGGKKGGGASRFMGPYHATDIVDFASNCKYAFKLTKVEGIPISHQHAKALLGTALHYVLEALHCNAIPHGWDDLTDGGNAGDFLHFVWEKMVKGGDPRYPDRADLPIHWGRVVEVPGSSRGLTRAEFEQKWLPKATEMIIGYAMQPWNHERKGIVETKHVEVGYELLITPHKKTKRDAYRIVGRWDIVRAHYSMDTIPRSLWDYERHYPGTIQELERRLKANGVLLEMADWKSGKDRPVYASQANPFVAFKREYQPRIYSLGMRDGRIGELTRVVDEDNKLIGEELLNPVSIGTMPDFYSWHWLPGYAVRDKSIRDPKYKGQRFGKANPAPGDLYIKKAGERLEMDPRYAVMITEEDMEMTRRDVIRVIGSIRLNQYYRSPGKFTCTMCKVERECSQDLETPLVDTKMMTAAVEDME